MKRYKLYLLILVLLLATPLRASVLILMPIFPIILFKIYPYTITKRSIGLLLLFALSSIIGLILGTTNPANVLLSCYIVIPIFIIFLAKPKISTLDCNIRVNSFIKYIIYTLSIVNILGLITYFVIYKAKDDDALQIMYGQHFSGVNGLAMLNACMFLYFISRIINGLKERKNIINAVFFFISFIFCFFGTGLICLIITAAIFVLLKAKLKHGIIIASLFIIGFFAFKEFNSRTFNYMKGSLTIGEEFPRKLLMFDSYSKFVKENPIKSLFGVGAGGYNGRVSFLLNKESDNIFTTIFGHQMPVFHEKNAYVFWNKDVTDVEEFTDGARNKPFSSVVSIFSEYGVIFGLIFFVYYLKEIINLKDDLHNSNNLFLFLIYIFFLLILFVDMWLESSEFLFFAIFQFLIKARDKGLSNVKLSDESNFGV